MRRLTRCLWLPLECEHRMTAALTTIALATVWLLLCRWVPELRRRTLNVLIAIDQLLWVVLTLGDGSPDETISAAAWRMEQQGKIAGRVLRPLIDLLFLPIERDHCRLSFESEVRGAQLPAAYRESP